MTGTNPDTILSSLRLRLRDPLPGHEAHLRMAPSHRRDPSPSVHGVYERDCRQAGVLALLDLRDDPSFVLTIRKPELNTHGGQISFPGGGCEHGETHIQTAMRETFEEVGAPPSSYHIAGALTPLYIPPSNYCVYPFLGILTTDVEWIVDTTEVAEILMVSLNALRSKKNIRENFRQIGDLSVEVPFFDIGGKEVWGATAMILAEIADVMIEIWQ